MVVVVGAKKQKNGRVALVKTAIISEIIIYHHMNSIKTMRSYKPFFPPVSFGTVSLKARVNSRQSTNACERILLTLPYIHKHKSKGMNSKGDHWITNVTWRIKRAKAHAQE